ncbi:MAG: hypothetical protein PVI88_00115 [Nitrosopumilaceae archaeon]|jgi:hypothetical protein
MAIENFKVTAYLVAPVVGEIPPLDSLLTYQLAFYMNTFKSKKYTKATPITEFERLPIPLTEYDVGGDKVNCCSDPVYIIETEWHDKLAKRFETDMLSTIIDPLKRKTINIGGGYLRSRFQTLHAKIISRVVWFARGDSEQALRLLKYVNSLGYFRKIGYGIVNKWNVEIIKENFSISARCSGKKILMKTLPVCDATRNMDGIRYGFGAYKPPYWHPENQCEVVVPC